jgi:hypothetical protein
MKEKVNSSKVTLNVEGMSCNHSSGTVKKAPEYVDLEGKQGLIPMIRLQ